jgi:hypothetical protein
MNVKNAPECVIADLLVVYTYVRSFLRRSRPRSGPHRHLCGSLEIYNRKTLRTVRVLQTFHT